MNSQLSKYPHLVGLGAPKALVEAIALLGIKEFKGTADCPVILGWAKEVGLGGVYSHDEIPWCGLFMAVVMHRAGKPVVDNPLWARNWAKFGNKSDVPSLGDVLVFQRGSAGHVALYVGEDSTHYHILGGNQSDSVCIVMKAKGDLIAARNFYEVAKPANCVPVHLSVNGGVASVKEV